MDRGGGSPYIDAMPSEDPADRDWPATRRQGDTPATAMFERARGVAIGFADIGLTRAEELLRRMSPEGREQARREREAKARRQKRLLTRLAIGGIVSVLAYAVLTPLFGPGIAIAGAAALMLLATTVIVLRAEPRAPGREALAQASLPELAEEAIVWLAAQRRGLPSEALRIAETMSRRLEALAPMLGRLDDRTPAAAAIHTLIAAELPALVDGWRTVPVSMRGEPRSDGYSPNDHLTGGLGLIDLELSRIGEQFDHGALDEIAIHGRYLELKYNDGKRAHDRA